MTAFDAALTVIRLADHVRLLNHAGLTVPLATRTALGEASRALEAALTTAALKKAA